MKTKLTYLLLLLVIFSCSKEAIEKEVQEQPTVPELVYPKELAIDVPTDVTVRWNSSEDNNGDDIEYSVYYNISPSNWILAGKTKDTSIQLKLEQNTPYYWYVSATDGITTPVESNNQVFKTEILDKGTRKEDFAITNVLYDNNTDSKSVINDVFGSEYRIVDWEDLIDIYKSGKDLEQFLDNIGIATEGSSIAISYKGKDKDSNRKSYVIKRHDHKKPSDYTIIEDIDNFQLVLGSSTDNKLIFAVKKDYVLVYLNLDFPYPNLEKSGLNQTIRWNGNAESYDIYCDQNNPPTVKINAANYAENTISVGNLKHNTTYYWKIVARKSNSNSESETRKFTTREQSNNFIDVVDVKSGSFKLGKTKNTYLSDYYIGKYEITNEQYCEFLNSIDISSEGMFNDIQYCDTKYADLEYKDNKFVPKADKNKYAIKEVSWYGAKAYCEWAGGNLPTEAEWEFAAIGGNNSEGFTYSGSNEANDVSWTKNNSGNNNHSVGQKKPNEIRAYDMTGNLWEWCLDWYDQSYYSYSPESNPQGPSTGTKKVLRGGSYYDDAKSVRARGSNSPEKTLGATGFRLVLKKDEVIYKTPSVRTLNTDYEYGYKANLPGAVIENGELPIVEKGIIYGTDSDLSFYKYDEIIWNNDVNTDFVCVSKELEDKTQYYYRTYIINSMGISYGNVLSFISKVYTAPIPIVNEIKDITYNFATVKVSIQYNGNKSPSEIGFIYSRNATPSMEDNEGKFSQEYKWGQTSLTETLNQLTDGIKYYIRPYAINEIGVGYGDIISLSTKTLETFVDSRDNRVYKKVTIGNQVWMAENLAFNPLNDNSGKYKDYKYWTEGTENTDKNNKWFTPYNNDESNVDKLGYLYTWNAVMNGEASSNSNPSRVQGICPEGWHLPSVAEVEELEAFLNKTPGPIPFKLMSPLGSTYKNISNNSSGFSAVPSSYIRENGIFRDMTTERCCFWLSTEYNSNNNTNAFLIYRIFHNTDAGSPLYKPYNDDYHYLFNKKIGYSVRCIKD